MFNLMASGAVSVSLVTLQPHSWPLIAFSARSTSSSGLLHASGINVGASLGVVTVLRAPFLNRWLGADLREGRRGQAEQASKSEGCLRKDAMTFLFAIQRRSPTHVD